MSLFKFREKPILEYSSLSTKTEARGLTSSFIIECITITPSQLPLEITSIMSFSNHCISGPFVTADILTPHIKASKCIYFSNPSLQKPFFFFFFLNWRFSAVLRPEAGSRPPSSTRSRFTARHLFSCRLITSSSVLLAASRGKPCVPSWWSQLVLRDSGQSSVTLSHAGADKSSERSPGFWASSSRDVNWIMQLFVSLCHSSEDAPKNVLSSAWPESHNSFIPELS